MRALPSLVLWVAVSSCGSAESSKACELEDRLSVEFVNVSLIEDFSNSICPQVEAEALNASFGDAGTETCETTVEGCALRVACNVQGVEGGGTLDYADGEFSGVLEVREPIECSYSVEATPK